MALGPRQHELIFHPRPGLLRNFSQTLRLDAIIPTSYPAVQRTGQSHACYVTTRS